MEIPRPERNQHSQLAGARIAIGWPRMLLSVTIILIILVIAAYLLILTYDRILSAQAGRLDRETRDIADTISREDLQQLMQLDLQIRNLSLLLDRHVHISHVLNEMERVTLPQVRYMTVAVRIEDGPERRIIAEARGIAPSLEAVSLQAAALGESDFVQDVRVNSVRVGEGGVMEFDINVLFNSSILHYRARPVVTPAPTPAPTPRPRLTPTPRQ